MTDNNKRFAKFGVLSGGNSNSTAPPAKPETACKADWTKCVDNSEMANNFDGYHKAEYACKRQATDLAKYGTPEWPWFAFGSFYPGPNTGTVTLIERDAKFQNGFGAMARSRVECQYDFRANKVVDVTISQR